MRRSWERSRPVPRRITGDRMFARATPRVCLPRRRTDEDARSYPRPISICKNISVKKEVSEYATVYSRPQISTHGSEDLPSILPPPDETRRRRVKTIGAGHAAPLNVAPNLPAMTLQTCLAGPPRFASTRRLLLHRKRHKRVVHCCISSLAATNR